MDKITLSREEQIRWAARMGELRARAMGRYEALRYSFAEPGRIVLVQKVARDLDRRWRYPTIGTSRP